MSSIERPAVVHHVAAEVTRLSAEQNLSLQKAGFVGLTEEELRLYEQRSTRIAELIKQLEMIR